MQARTARALSSPVIEFIALCGDRPVGEYRRKDLQRARLAAAIDDVDAVVMRLDLAGWGEVDVFAH